MAIPIAFLKPAAGISFMAGEDKDYTEKIIAH